MIEGVRLILFVSGIIALCSGGILVGVILLALGVL